MGWGTGLYIYKGWVIIVVLRVGGHDWVVVVMVEWRCEGEWVILRKWVRDII